MNREGKRHVQLHVYVSLLHQKCPLPFFTVSQSLGLYAEAGRHPGTRTEEEHSVDGDLVHHFKLATRKSCVYSSSTPALKRPQPSHPNASLLCFPHMVIFPWLHVWVYREGLSGVRSEWAPCFHKEQSAFPSCRTSNSMSLPGSPLSMLPPR